MLRGNALGMELHAVHGEFAMGEAHDQPVLALRRDLEAGRQRCPLDHKRVVAGRGEARRNVMEYALALMRDLAQLAVHGRGAADDLAAEGLPDGLMPETNAEYGDPAGGPL